MGRRKKIKSKDFKNATSGCGCLIVTLLVIGLAGGAYEFILELVDSNTELIHVILPYFFDVGIGLILLVISIAMLKSAIATRRYNRQQKISKQRADEKRARLLGSAIEDLDVMKGRVFEEWILAVLQNAGIDSQIPTSSADFGVDLTASWNGTMFAIQAKRYSKNVGVKAINEVRAGAEHWDCQVAVVVTQRYYTRQAKELVGSMKIPFILIDRDNIDQIPRTLKNFAQKYS